MDNRGFDMFAIGQLAVGDKIRAKNPELFLDNGLLGTDTYEVIGHTETGKVELKKHGKPTLLLHPNILLNSKFYILENGRSVTNA